MQNIYKFLLLKSEDLQPLVIINLFKILDF